MTNGLFHGELVVTTIDKKGNRFEYITPNTLTGEASRIMSHLLVGDAIGDLVVNRLAVGTGNTPPVRGDEALGNEVYQQAIDGYTYPSVGHTEYKTVIDFVCAANGHVLAEAGLMGANGTSLFARQVHTPIAKDSNFKVEYRWRIVYT